MSPAGSCPALLRRRSSRGRVGDLSSGKRLEMASRSKGDRRRSSSLGPAAMGNPANQAWLDSIWNYTVAQSQTSAANSYYSASLMLQSMIVMSGNYWAP